MAGTCPFNTVDEYAARTVAAFVVLLSALSLWTPAWFLMVFLAVDFTIRGFIDRRYSPLRWVAKHVVAVLPLDVKPVYAPPKQFAAQIGATIAVLSMVLRLAGFHVAAEIVTGLLIGAASLEAGLGFCVACWLYPLVHKFREGAL